MGCDIHTYREKFVGGQWVTADRWNYHDDEGALLVSGNRRAYSGRNYFLFGLLSKGVRCDVPYGLPRRGIPFDACSEYRSEVDQWNGDGHSHSYLYLHEIVALRCWVNDKSPPDDGMEHHVGDALDEIVASFGGIDGDNQRLCFFFDN